MGTKRLTDRWLRTHRPEGREEWSDDVVSGLMVRFGAGSVVFYARLRVEGVYSRQRVGAFPAIGLPEARQAVRDMIHAREKDEPIRAEGSFAALCREYLKGHAKRHKKSFREDERIIEGELIPKLGAIKAGAIRRKDLNALFDAIVERGAPVMANRVRQLLRRIFKFGIAREIVDENPAAGTERPTRETPRQFDLDDEQLASVWRALEFRHPTARNMIRLLILTGCRSGEARLAKWGEFKRDHWEIPGARTKNGRTHIVPISEQTAAVIEAQRGLWLGGEFVFPSPRDVGEPWNQSSLSHFARSLRAKVGVDWQPKDLRTTAVTLLNRLGFSEVAPKVVNHTDSTVTARYNKYDFLKEKREALEALGAHVQAILSA